MSDDTSNLEAVSRRIRGLISKTIENGATEQEAILASFKARELMDRYRLSMTDIQVKAEPIDQITIDRPTKTRLAAVDYCITGISKYCGVKIWLSTRGKVTQLTMLGLRGDVQMAQYLYDMLSSVIKAEGELYYLREQEALINRIVEDQGNYVPLDKRNMKVSFQVGMATRINERLVQMAKDLEPVAKTSSGTALVVVKGALVEDAFRALNLHLRAASGALNAKDYAAYGEGKKVAEKVNLGRPVGTSNTRRI